MPRTDFRSLWMATLGDGRWIWLLLILPVALFLPALPIDETRYLGVAWEMRVHGDFIVPHLNGATYSDKPPLLFWLINIAWTVFGYERVVGAARRARRVVRDRRHVRAADAASRCRCRHRAPRRVHPDGHAVFRAVLQRDHVRRTADDVGDAESARRDRSGSPTMDSRHRAAVDRIRTRHSHQRSGDPARRGDGHRVRTVVERNRARIQRRAGTAASASAFSAAPRSDWRGRFPQRSAGGPRLFRTRSSSTRRWIA